MSSLFPFKIGGPSRTNTNVKRCSAADGTGFKGSCREYGSERMVFLITATIGLCLACFGLGWLRGYTKACRAHEWNLPQIDWKSVAGGSRRS